MYAQASLSILAVAVAGVAAQTGTPVTGNLGNATLVSNNPPGVVYKAVLPDKAFWAPAYPNGDNVKGTVLAVADPSGVGVIFKVTFSNLPKEGGPFPYHIHVNPVPGDGNCTSTLAHLDPYIRGEDPVCNSTLPQTCQVGDLSGKHGKITSDPYTLTYVDPYASTVDGIGAFFGNRSFVVHFSNKTRISCANFGVVDGTQAPPPPNECSASGPSSTSSPTTKPTGYPNTTTAPPTTVSTKPTQSVVTVNGAAGVRSTLTGVGAAGVLALIAFML